MKHTVDRIGMVEIKDGKPTIMYWSFSGNGDLPDFECHTLGELVEMAKSVGRFTTDGSEVDMAKPIEFRTVPSPDNQGLYIFRDDPRAASPSFTVEA